jgi:hypothetical protein
MEIFMVEFTWHIAVEGYKWEKEEPKPGPNSGSSRQNPTDDEVIDEELIYLVPVSWRFRAYAPLEEFSGLFRTFAQTIPNEEGILDFANRHGNLGAELDARMKMEDPPEPPEECKTREEQEEWYVEEAKNWRRVDSLERWIKEIEQMQKCVNLWDKAQLGEVRDRSMQDVQGIINFELSSENVMVRFGQNRKLGGLGLQVIPKSLLGALWLQFALAVGGNKKYRACGTCGQWFELSPDIARTTKHFCSDACRSRAYRGRKERAQLLAAEGKSLKDIAEQLESEVKTVKGWLKQGRK